MERERKLGRLKGEKTMTLSDSRARAGKRNRTEKYERCYFLLKREEVDILIINSV